MKSVSLCQNLFKFPQMKINESRRHEISDAAFSLYLLITLIIILLESLIIYHYFVPPPPSRFTLYSSVLHYRVLETSFSFSFSLFFLLSIIQLCFTLIVVSFLKVREILQKPISKLFILTYCKL